MNTSLSNPINTDNIMLDAMIIGGATIGTTAPTGGVTIDPSTIPSTLIPTDAAGSATVTTGVATGGTASTGAGVSTGTVGSTGTTESPDTPITKKIPTDLLDSKYKSSFREDHLIKTGLFKPGTKKATSFIENNKKIIYIILLALVGYLVYRYGFKTKAK